MFSDPHLAALAAVHRRGSFELAATGLNLTPSAISQRIKALEERVGTLLIRRGQPCTATETGLRLIRHHDEVQLLETALAQDLPGPAPQATTLRIAVNADSLATWIIPALAETQGFLFDLVIDDEKFSQDWLRRGEVAAAVTAQDGPLQGCETIPLGALRFLATASPAYIARWLPDGPTAAALSHAPSLTFSAKKGLEAAWVQRLTGRPVACPVHQIASTQAFLDASLAGLGWCLNPESLAAPHLASGALVELAPGTPFDLLLFWQFSRLTAAATAPLTRAIRNAASARLHQRM